MTDLILTSPQQLKTPPLLHSRAFVAFALLGFALLGLVLSGTPLKAGRDDTWKSRVAKFEQRGDLQAANAAYRDRLVRDRQDLTALRGLAVNLTLMQRYSEALPFQEQVVKLDPHDAQTRVELAFNYLNHQKRPDAAIQPMREAVGIASSSKHRTFLAQVLIRSGRVREARVQLETAIAAEPTYGYSYMVLYRLLRQQGDAVGAGIVRMQAHDRAGIDLADSQETK